MHIDAPPDAVFGVLADGDRYADWVVGAKQIRHTEPGFPRPGTRLHHTLGTGPVEVSDTTDVVVSEPPLRLELDAHIRGLRATVRFVLHPDSTGTNVVMEEEVANRATRVLARVTRAVVATRNAETLWRLNAQVLNRSETSRPTPTPARANVPVPRWLGDATARVFAFAAALRGARAMHPRGVVMRGTARLTERGRGIAEREAPTVVARFSRGAGLPARVPDVNGLALRVVDASGPGRHVDLLFASSGPGPLSRLVVPGIDFSRSRLSTLLPYRFDGERVLFVASVGPSGLTLDRLADARVVVDVAIVTAAGAREPVARVELDEVVGGDVRFDPTRATATIVPLGFLNALRTPAYAASQAVRAGRRHLDTNPG